MRRVLLAALAAGLLLGLAGRARADEVPASTRTEDVIYGRKYGTALTMDVFTPKKKANGAAVIVVVSGGWFSDHDGIPGREGFFGTELLKRGYTVFAVVHGSQPKYTIPEVLAGHAPGGPLHPPPRQGLRDRPRPHRHHRRLGGRPPVADAGHGRRRRRPQGQGPHRPRVQPGAGRRLLLPADRLPQLRRARGSTPRPRRAGRFQAAFDFREFDPKTKRLEPLTDGARRRRWPAGFRRSRTSAPTTRRRSSSTATPTSWCRSSRPRSIVAKLKEAGVPAELVVKKGAAHGWADMDKDMPTLADWFDKHLKRARVRGFLQALSAQEAGGLPFASGRRTRSAIERIRCGVAR